MTGLITDMEIWVEVRRRVLTGELSKRAACREYEIHWQTLEKILSRSEPPGYQQTKPRSSKVDAFVPIIEEILQSDRQVHRKQRHTARRIFERLRDEHGYVGVETVVKDAVRTWKQQNREVFLPLSHPPGEAQVDFGFADVWLAGELTKAALFVMTLPYSDAIFIQAFPRECTEAFLEGHRRAFEFFGGVPTRISYDNSKIAVGSITGSRERKVTREFQRLKSHFLFIDHFCLARRPNEKGHVERLVDFSRRNFLVPVPRVEMLEALNVRLLDDCGKDLQRQLSAKTASKAFEETLPHSDKPLQLLTTGEHVRSIHGASYTRLWNVELLDMVKEYASDFRPPQVAMDDTSTGFHSRLCNGKRQQGCRSPSCNP